MRIAVVWFGAHVLAGGAFAAAPETGVHPFALPLRMAVWLWLFIVAAVLVDLRVTGEEILLGNLGVSRRFVAVAALLECVALERTVRGLVEWLT